MSMDSPRSTYLNLTIGERICAALIPFVEVLICAVTNCFNYCPHIIQEYRYTSEDFARLADETRSLQGPSSGDCNSNDRRPCVLSSNDLWCGLDVLITINEVEALYVLFKRLSSSIIDDGLIHKEELQLALFQTPNVENLFLDQVFDLFDEKRNGVIGFEEFVHALSVFHPYAPIEEKIDFAFRLYDLKQTGSIEREDVKLMVIAMMMEFEIKLSDDLLEAIVDKTFADTDKDNDGKISKEDWRAFVSQNPTLLKNMTLPHLKDITTVFPNYFQIEG